MSPVIIFFIPNDLTQMVTFQLGSLTVVLLGLLFWIYLFIYSTLSISYSSFSSIGKFWSCCCLSVSIDFPLNSKGEAPFHQTSYDYPPADWDGLPDHLRDGSLEDIFKLGAFAESKQKQNKRETKRENKRVLLSQKSCSRDFWQMFYIILNKSNFFSTSYI